MIYVRILGPVQLERKVYKQEPADPILLGYVFGKHSQPLRDFQKTLAPRGGPPDNRHVQDHKLTAIVNFDDLLPTMENCNFDFENLEDYWETQGFLVHRMTDVTNTNRDLTAWAMRASPIQRFQSMGQHYIDLRLNGLTIQAWYPEAHHAAMEEFASDDEEENEEEEDNEEE